MGSVSEERGGERGGEEGRREQGGGSQTEGDGALGDYMAECRGHQLRLGTDITSTLTMEFFYVHYITSLTPFQ